MSALAFIVGLFIGMALGVLLMALATMRHLSDCEPPRMPVAPPFDWDNRRYTL